MRNFALRELDIPTTQESSLQIPQNSIHAVDLGLQNPEQTRELPQFPNIIPAIPTTYTSDGAIDYLAFDAQLESLVNDGIRAVLVAGTTGESSLMTHDEQIALIQHAVSIGRRFGIQVIAGTGANSTHEQNNLTERAFSVGANAALLLPPYYIKCSPQYLVEHFWQALNRGPGILYSITGRTGITIPLEVIYELSNHPHFLGVKECDGAHRIRTLTDRGIRVWSGNDDTAYSDIRNSGAVGTISVTTNMDPQTMLEVGERSENLRAQERSTHLARIAFPKDIPNPGAIHSFIEMQFQAWLREYNRHQDIIKNHQSPRNLFLFSQREGWKTPENREPSFRLPVGPLSLNQQHWMRDELSRLGIQVETFNRAKTFA